MASRTYASTPSRVQIQPSTPLDEDGGVLCSGHKRRAVKFTSGPHTKNPGRRFYACPLKQGEEGRCKFFKWEDEIQNEKTPSSHVPGPSLHVLATPKSIRKTSTDDIDWDQVDTDALEREAIASTPSSSQGYTPASQTPFTNRLQALADDTSRKRKREDDTPRAENPFLSSSTLHPMLGDISDHLHRQERLLAAAEKAKEGFRKTIKQRDEKIKEQEALIKQLKERLGEV